MTKNHSWSIRRNYGRVVYGGHVDEEMASKGENRLKSYKTKGLDVEEIRRRKEEEGVQLRRSRREEQVLCGAGWARGRGAVPERAAHVREDVLVCRGDEENGGCTYI